MSGTPTLQPVEQELGSFLRELTGVPVGKRVPSPRPSSFIVLRRAGGARRNLVQSEPTLLLEIWGSKDPAVSPWPLAKQVWEALARADETGVPGLEVMAVSVTEPVDYPDEASGAPRYTMLFTPTLNL